MSGPSPVRTTHPDRSLHPAAKPLRPIGRTYSVYVAPSDPSVDFDLYVYDEKGILIAQDDTPRSDAWCYITPRWTGPFRLVVKAARGFSTYHVRVEG